MLINYSNVRDIMYKVRTIVIPDDADEIYTRDYFKKMGRDLADKTVEIIKSHLIEKYGYELE